MAAEREGREALFDAAVSALLRGWPALKMAVSNQFGGPQSQAKATWMEGATAQWMRENGERRVLRTVYVVHVHVSASFLATFWR